MKFHTLVPNLPVINGSAKSNEHQKLTQQSTIKLPDAGNHILDKSGKHCFQNKSINMNAKSQRDY
jgi:hypothetical protein